MKEGLILIAVNSWKSYFDVKNAPRCFAEILLQE
jgi:hypothetical protein